MFNRQQYSKMITNSLIMIYIFYILLAVLTRGFVDLLLPGWIPQHILLIPILLGYLGLCWGIYNLTYDPLVSWKNSKKVVIFILAGTVSLLVSTIIMMVSEVFQEQIVIVFIFTIIGITLLIVAEPLIALGFYFFRKDLKEYYFRKFISKYPNLFIIISYSVLSLGLIFLTIGGFIPSVKGTIVSYLIQSLDINILIVGGFNAKIIGSVFIYLGIGTIALSIIGLGVGYYPLYISFRTYPKLLEYLEEAQKKKNQSSMKKTKKTS